jgi:hypothetical protein
MARNSVESKPHRWFRRSSSWLDVKAVLAVGGMGAGLLMICGEWPILGSWLIIAAAGYALWFAGANIIGVLLWIAVAAMLSVALWTNSRSLFPPDILLALIGFLISFPAGMVFLVASIRNRRRCCANCAGCMLVFFTVLIFCVPGWTFKRYRCERDDRQETRQTIFAAHCLASESDAIFARLGRVPRDEAELVALRGKPMPPHVFYRERGKDRYLLSCDVPQLWGYRDAWGLGFALYGKKDALGLRVDSGF